MARVAQLVVDIDARTQGLEASMQKTREEIKQVGVVAQQTSVQVDQFAASVGNVVTFFRRTAIGAGIIEAFRLISQAAAATTKDLAKLSDEASQAKVTPEDYQVFQIIAERTGRSVNDVIKVLKTSSAAFKEVRAEVTATGEVIETRYVEQAKRLEEVQAKIQRQIDHELAPGFLELRRTQIIAKDALAELGAEWLKGVTGAGSFKDAMTAVDGVVQAAIVNFAGLGAVVGNVGQILSSAMAALQAFGVWEKAQEAGRLRDLGAQQNLRVLQEQGLEGDPDAQRLRQQSQAETWKQAQDRAAAFQMLQDAVTHLGEVAGGTGQAVQEAMEKARAALAKTGAEVDKGLNRPSVPDAVAKGSAKAQHELEQLRKALEELGAQQSNIAAEYEQAQARLVAVQSGGSEALKLVEDQQKVADAYRKTYDSVHKAAEAARLSTEEQDKQAKSAAGLAAQTVTLNEKISQTASDQKLLQDAFEGTWTEAERVDAQMRKLHDAADRLGVVVSGDQWDKIHESLSKTNDDMKELSDQIQSSVVGAFEDLGMSLVQGKLDMQEFTRSFLLDIGRIILRLSIMKAITAAMGMFGGGGSAGTAPLGNLNATGTPGLTLGAKGMVLEYGNATPFATGGIIGKPTLFPMANGAGLMGEAGPEAVMPLARTSTGELGVKGGGSNVVINIMTPAGTEATTERHQDASGNEQIDVLIQSRVERIMATGRLDQAMRNNFGVTRAGRR